MEKLQVRLQGVQIARERGEGLGPFLQFTKTICATYIHIKG